MLNEISKLYDQMARPEEAIRSRILVLAIRRETKDKAGEAIALYELAVAQTNATHYEEATGYFNQALPIFRELKDKTGEANTLYGNAFSYGRLNRYGESLRLYNLALPIRQELKDRQGEADVLSGIGSIYGEINRPDEALRNLNQSIPIFQELKDKLGQANAWERITNVYYVTGRYDEGLVSANKALLLMQEIHDRQGEAFVLTDIGSIHNEAGPYDEAMRYFNQVLPIHRELKNKMGESRTLANLGLIYGRLKRYEDAQNSFDLALSISRELKDRGNEANILNNLMRLSFLRDHLPLSIFYGKQSINVTQSVRRDIQSLDKQSRDAFLNDNKDTYETLAALLIRAGRLPEAEQVTRLLKQSETFDFVRRDASLSALPEALSLNVEESQYLSRYNELGDQSTTVGERIAALEVKRPSERTDAEKTQLAQLRADQKAINGRWEIFRRELTLAFTKDGDTTLEKVDVATSDAWQKALQNLEAQGNGPTVLLSTVIAPDRFYIVLTSAHGRQQFSSSISRGDLNALVARLRGALADPTRDPIPDAKKLYDVVFCNGELEKALQALGIKTVLWSLSGSLRYIPLDALYDGKGYLLERDRIDAVMTLTSKDYFAAPKGGDALAVGTSQAHTVELKDQSGAAQQLSFEALSQVPSEVRGIIKEAGKGGTGPLGGELLLDKDFTAQSLETALQDGYRTVHVATHFRLQPGDDRTSFLLLGDGSPLPVFDWKVKMPLSGVELLTLSACETGVAGDGATGAEVGSLGEIAQRLGAASVVASLWPVADSSTSLLMRDFYTRWQAHPELGKGQALRQAQRALLLGTAPVAPATPDAAPRGMMLNPLAGVTAKPTATFHPDPKRPYAHPFYWAPFFLTGNWR